MGENQDAREPYMMWRRSLNEPFGAEDHLIPVFGSDYLKILRDFIRCQSLYADNLELDRIHRRPDDALTAKDCVKGGMDEDLKGKVVAIRADALSPEYRARSHQLMLATGGFGCAPDARGRAVFGLNIYSGTPERWDRSDLLGVVDENTLPAWAREKLAALRNPAEKESVLGKIREDRQMEALRKPKQNHHDKGGPEL